MRFDPASNGTIFRYQLFNISNGIWYRYSFWLRFSAAHPFLILFFGAKHSKSCDFSVSFRDRHLNSTLYQIAEIPQPNSTLYQIAGIFPQPPKMSRMEISELELPLIDPRCTLTPPQNPESDDRFAGLPRHLPL